jgi:DNA-binding NarL/FixJ family response regulator
VISVLLVDDHDLIRQGIRRAFEHEGDFTVLGEAGTIKDAEQLVDELRPEVVVLDVRLPDGSGLDLAKRLRASHPRIGIVMLTMYAGDDQLFAALESGASAFVNKDAPAEQLAAAARHAAASPETFTARDLAQAVLRRNEPTGPVLTAREREVLTLLAEGLSISALAKRLYVSESTAKSHISKLYEKLGAANRAQALMTAVRLGLVAGSDQP